MRDLTSITSFSSLVEPLLERAAFRPDERALVLIDNEGLERPVTVGQLHAEAMSWARALAAAGIDRGEIVILALRHSLDLIAAFWGTLYQGGIPSIFPYLVPMPSPEKFVEQIKTVVSNSGARAVVTLPEFRTGLAASLTPLDCRVLSPQELPNREGMPETGHPKSYASGEQIAYLQYTSGTTGMQKGVLLSHRAILNCVQSFARAVAIDGTDVVVNWLPLYHDYGLFAGLVLGLLVGIPTVLMSPFKWVRNPKSLLWAIHHHRGTLSWMPNSAYCHAINNIRPADIVGLDLSSLRCLGSAAEPVMYLTQQRFLDQFGPYGFKETALMTGYGMAENSLAISISAPDRRAPVDWADVNALQKERFARPTRPQEPQSIPFVSCGSAVEGAEIVIVDDGGQPLPERGVGEISIRTKSLFSGYHRRPDLTSKTVRDGWFFTGDLGYLAGGQVYVCGRKKDLIIQAGHNIHPEDLEAVANTVSGVTTGQVVAFGVPDEKLGTEKVVLVCDLRRRVDEAEKLSLERELRHRVHEDLCVTLSEVYLMEKAWIARTHNGKIARRANLEKYLSEHKDAD